MKNVNGSINIIGHLRKSKYLKELFESHEPSHTHLLQLCAKMSLMKLLILSFYSELSKS